MIQFGQTLGDTYMYNKCASILKLTLSCILGLTFLVGCGGNGESTITDSKTSPVISNVTYDVDARELIVEATDDVKVEGYLLSLSSEKPDLKDKEWTTSNSLHGYGKLKRTLKDTNLYIWVKDADGNLTMSELYFKGDMYYMAEYYDHLQWYLDDSTTKTVDGVTYDIQALKKEYGDLYRFVEPLTKEEVDYRFQYLAEFFVIQVQNGSFELYNGGILELPSKSATVFFALRETFYEKMATTADEKLKKYSSYYFFLEKTRKYYKNEKSILNDINGMPELINVVDLISFNDKEWFVRNYMAEVELVLKTLEENNEFPIYNFKAEQRTK